MSVFDFARQQTATYWAKDTSDGFGGYSFSPPVQLKVRWEDKTEQKIQDDGKIVISRSSVWVGRDMVEGDFLFLGTSTNADPAAVTGAYRILSVDKVPDLFGGDFERVAFL